MVDAAHRKYTHGMREDRDRCLLEAIQAVWSFCQRSITHALRQIRVMALTVNLVFGYQVAHKLRISEFTCNLSLYPRRCSSNDPSRPAGERHNANLVWTTEMIAGTQPEILFCRQDHLHHHPICSSFRRPPDTLPLCTIYCPPCLTREQRYMSWARCHRRDSQLQLRRTLQRRASRKV